VTKHDDGRRSARPADGPAATSGDRWDRRRRATGMDQGRFSTMTDVHRLETLPAGPGKGTVLAAWGRFAQGEDRVPGVGPEAAIS
jgi:sigma-54 dependent transcriptional regulator, acetoin dehydrogenase operon transcriptional activator AcoR